VKESLSCAIPFRDRLQQCVDRTKSTIENPELRNLLIPLVELMATSGSEVLDVASRLAFDIEWPDAIPDAAREQLRAALLHEMQRHISATLIAQTNALLAFQHRSFELIFAEIAAAASRVFHPTSKAMN
jgi:hypothetical protein